MRARKTTHHRHCTCIEETLDVQMKSDLCLMVHETDQERLAALTEDFLHDHLPQLKRIVSRVCRNANIPFDQKAVVWSYVGEALLNLVNRIWREHPVQFDTMTSVPYILDHRTREILREDRRMNLLDGGYAFQGNKALVRKLEQFRKSQQEYAAMYSEAGTEAEVIKFHNDKMRRNRTNAQKQGVLIDKKDLVMGTTLSLDVDLAHLRYVHGELADVDLYDETYQERLELVQAVFKACARKDQNALSRSGSNGPSVASYETVARVMYSKVDEGRVLERDEVCAILGIDDEDDVREIGKRMSTVRRVSKRIFLPMLERTMPNTAAAVEKPKV